MALQIATVMALGWPTPFPTLGHIFALLCMGLMEVMGLRGMMGLMRLIGLMGLG